MIAHSLRLVPFLIFFVCASRSAADAIPVFIDGVHSDWAGVNPMATDPSGDGGNSGIDFISLSIANDGPSLFIRLQLRFPTILQEDNAIALYIDTDDNASTGLPVSGIGADLIWRFGGRNGVRNGIGTGWAGVGIVASPSWESIDFEISIPRTAGPGETALFTSPTIRLLFRDEIQGGDAIPAVTPEPYAFDDSDPLFPEPISPGRSPRPAYRIMTHNVERDGLWRDSNEHTRLVQAIQPDIIAYQEIYNHGAGEMKAWVEARLPGDWNIAYDGRQLHTVSRWPITQSWSTAEGRAYATLIDIPDEFGSDLLLINLHFHCCRRDLDRQREIDDLMRFIRGARLPDGGLGLQQGTAIVILGDTNMYGDAHQVETLLTGNIFDNSRYGGDFRPDWDETDLEALYSPHLNSRHSFTWYNEGSAYSPSHIDRIAYTGSVIEPVKSFALHTPHVDPDTLFAYGLEESDSKIASDHVPHVVDFVPASADTSSEGEEVEIEEAGEVPSPSIDLRIIPNPMNPSTSIEFTIELSGPVSLTIYDSAGRRVATLFDETLIADSYSVRWAPNGDIASGIYFAHLKTAGRDETKKLILLR